MKRGSIGRRTVAGAASVFLVGSLAACGSGSTAAEDASDGQTSMTLATSISGSSFLGVTAGVEQGIFEEHGIDLEVVKVKNTSEGAAALASGQADVASVLTEGIISMSTASGDAKIIANLLTEDQHILYGGEGITELEDVVGGKFGVVSPGNGTELLAKHLMESEGHGVDSTEYVPSGSGPAQMSALISGQVDVAGLVPPYDHMAEKEGLKKIVEYRDLLPGLTPQVFAARQDSIENNSDALRKFLEAYAESAQWIVENEEEAVRILQEDTNTDEETARASYEFAKPNYSLDGHVDPAGLERWLEISSKYGSHKGTTSLDDIYTDELLGESQ